MPANITTAASMERGQSVEYIFPETLVRSVAEETYQVCLHDKGTSFTLELDNAEDRTNMKEALLKVCDGNYREIQTNDNPDWWQVVLTNGAIIRVCPKED